MYKIVQRRLGPRSRADSSPNGLPRVRPEGLMGYGNMLISLYEDSFISRGS
jgi:hypothetical protein